MFDKHLKDVGDNTTFLIYMDIKKVKNNIGSI